MVDAPTPEARLAALLEAADETIANPRSGINATGWSEEAILAFISKDDAAAEPVNPIGSTFESWLEEEGIREEVYREASRMTVAEWKAHWEGTP